MTRMLPAPRLGLPTETWPTDDAYRQANGGLGMCNTGSGLGCVCVLNGIGCNVDHVAIARANLDGAAR